MAYVTYADLQALLASLVKAYSDNPTVITALDMTSDEVGGVEQDGLMKIITEANRALAYAKETTINSRASILTEQPGSAAVVKLNKDEIDVLNGLVSAAGSVLKMIKDNAQNATFTPTGSVAAITLALAIAELDTEKIAVTQKGAASGVAPLTAGSLIDTVYLPSYVDDVIEVANYAALPVTGETGKIYITIDTGYTYRWSGAAYVQLTDATAIWGQISGTLLNQLDLQAALDLKAPLASPTFTGTPLAPTPAIAIDSTQIATTAFVQNLLKTNYYGVSWDESADTYLRTGKLAGLATSQTLAAALLPIQSAMRRCVINDDGVVQYYLDPSDSTLKEGGGAADLTGADGQVMVQIPAFYYRYAYAGTTHTWEISLAPLSGFSLHPAFIKNDEYVPYRYMGAYEGSLYDVSASRYTNGLQLPAVSMVFANATSLITCASLSHPFSKLETGDKFIVAGTVSNNGTLTVASKTDQTITTVEALVAETAASTTLETEKNWAADILCSVSGKAPINDGTRANFRSAAATRGTGWRQMDYDLASAVQLLYVIEYADFNSQSMIGAGLTNFGSTNWANWNNYNPIELAGNSNGNGNDTANLDNGANVIGSYMSYRGIENFYGHIWKWMDGININANVPYVCNKDTDFADDTLSNYTALGITLINANGYQKTLEQTPRGFLPASVGGASNTFITDYYYQSTGWRVAILGGNANNGGFAGAFYLKADDASSTLYRAIGGRVCF